MYRVLKDGVWSWTGFEELIGLCISEGVVTENGCGLENAFLYDMRGKEVNIGEEYALWIVMQCSDPIDDMDEALG